MTTFVSINTQDIYVSANADAREYTWATSISAADGADISADPIEIGLGSSDGKIAPLAWVASTDPNVLTEVIDDTLWVSLYITNATDVGYYYVWIRLTDNPEVVPRRGHKIHVH